MGGGVGKERNMKIKKKRKSKKKQFKNIYIKVRIENKSNKKNCFFFLP